MYQVKHCELNLEKYQQMLGGAESVTGTGSPDLERHL